MFKAVHRLPKLPNTVLYRLVQCFGGWLGGPVDGCPTPPPPSPGVGQFWLPGVFPKSGWVGLVTPPPPYG